MGISRRNRSTSNASNSNRTNSPHPPQRQRTPLQRGDQPSPAPGMSPISRYNNNLRVLRRRDPSIVSIFDQFSHVCVYHHNGEKWEKQGFEGSMFVYERDSYPPYGFYILNRMGMDDYIQRLYPEDDIDAHKDYLMLRSYPDYTSRRLSLLPSPVSPASKFDESYALHDPAAVKDKGRSITVGLWMFATEKKQPMIEVMMRLHAYIKRNAPYPEEFRFGPDRVQRVCAGAGTSGDEREGTTPAASDIDKLFAKMGNGEVKQSVPSMPSSRGLALLDSIFASASFSETPPPPPPRQETPPHIYSPVPSTSGLPQILNQDVIATLLGLPPRAASSSSREGGDEGGASEGGDEGEASASASEGEGAAVLGDVTPRPALRPELGSAQPQPTPRKGRALVPFDADSALWPYPRAPVVEEEAEGDVVVEMDFEETSALRDLEGFKKGKGKRSRKEKAAANVKEREEIEKSWDVPAPVPAPAPVVNGKSQLSDRGVDKKVAQAAIVSAVSTPRLARNEFIREVLTLIHTDKGFVDGLYQDYMSRMH